MVYFVLGEKLHLIVKQENDELWGEVKNLQDFSGMKKRKFVM